MPLPKKGHYAPEFELPDETGTLHKLADYRGKWTLVYFYPKDDTPGCTQEACTIRDSFLDFKKFNAVVLGISVDSMKSHKKFSQKYHLPFTLLSDSKKEVVAAYGVWGKKKFMGREYTGTKRTSILVDPKGIIVKVYENVKPALHAGEVLHDLSLLTKDAS